MASDPSRLDLVRSSATELALEALLELDSASFTDLLVEYAVRASSGRSVAFFYTEYRRSRVEHACLGSIVQVKPGGEEYRLVLTYSVGTTASVPVPEGTRPVLDMLHMLSDMPEEHAFDCRASFRYRASEYVSCVPMPLVVGHATRLPYTDIRGVHLAKVRDEAHLYDIIIDHAPPKADTVRHLISFEYLSRFTPELPSDVLRFAAGISKEFGGPDE